MSENPFDKTLSPQTREKVRKAKSLLVAQAEADNAVKTCDINRQSHKNEWKRHKRELHTRRLEQAVEREQTQGRVTPDIRIQQDIKDDKRFAHIKHKDQLLELELHEDYLRGHRALERRISARKTAKKPGVVVSEKQSDLQVGLESFKTGFTGASAGLQIWICLTGIFIWFPFMGVLFSSPLVALALLPIFFCIWMVIVALPSWVFGGWGPGKGGGRAV